MPGLMIGQHKTLSHFLTALRTTSRQHELHVVIHTWDTDENNLWLDKTLELIALMPGVIPHVVQEEYNSKEFLKFSDKFHEQMSLPTHKKQAPHPKALKRLFMSYSLIQCLKKVHELGFNEDFIMKLRTNCEYSSKYGKESFWPRFQQYLSGYFYHNMPIEYQTADINEVLFTDFSSHYAVSEKFLAGGFAVFEQLFGIDELEFAGRWGQLHKEYALKYMPEELTDDNQDQFWRMEMFAPVEGSLMLNDFIQMFFPGTIIHGILILPELINFLPGRAALFEISKDEVKLTQSGLIDYANDGRFQYLLTEGAYQKALEASRTNPSNLDLYH